MQKLIVLQVGVTNEAAELFGTLTHLLRRFKYATLVKLLSNDLFDDLCRDGNVASVLYSPIN